LISVDAIGCVTFTVTCRLLTFTVPVGFHGPDLPEPPLVGLDDGVAVAVAGSPAEPDGDEPVGDGEAVPVRSTVPSVVPW
jgi:hypothetical protein